MKWIVSSIIAHILLVFIFESFTQPLNRGIEKPKFEKLTVYIKKEALKKKEHKAPTTENSKVLNSVSKRRNSNISTSKILSEVQGTIALPQDQVAKKISNYQNLMPGVQQAISNVEVYLPVAEMLQRPNEYGDLETDKKIDIDEVLGYIEIPFVLKTEVKEGSATILIKYDQQSRSWVITDLLGNNPLFKVLLFDVVHIKRNLELFAKVLNHLQKNTLILSYRYRHNPESATNYDDRLIHLSGANLTLSEVRHGGQRSTGNLPDAVAEKRVKRDLAEINKMKQSKAYAQRIQNEVIKILE